MDMSAFFQLHCANSRALLTTIAASLWLTHPISANATNGLNQIGFGVESVGMAGADIAVARDTSALNTNPAGLMQVPGALVELNSAVAYTGNIGHADQFGSSRRNSNRYPMLGNMGYATRLSDLPVTVGIGLFAQGGTGNQFNNMTTAFGTIDDLSVVFRVARITPGLAWQVNDTLSVGLSLIGTYSDLEQEVFPDTSFENIADPTKSFFGFKLEKMNDFSVGVKLGVMYKPNDWLTLGAAYNNKIDLDLEGKMQVNLSALGLGKVTYEDAVAKNVDQPRELGVGAAIQASDALLLSFEWNWIDWSDAVTAGVVTARSPNNPAAPPVLTNVTDNDWRDQHVIAIGAAYQLDEKTLVRAGYNYGRNPISGKHLNPLLNTIAEHHLTVGFDRELGNAWQLGGAVEWNIRNEVTYTNPQLPFGENAEAVGELFALHIRLSRSW